MYTNKQECNFSKVENVNKSIQSLWIHYLNHINGEEFKGLLKTFLLWFKINQSIRHSISLWVGPWNVSVKIFTSEMAGSWGQWSTYSDSGHRNGTSLRLQPVCGARHTQRVHLSEWKNIKSWQLSVSRCFIFFNIKFGLCLLDYIESCDIWDFVGPTWCIWQSSQELIVLEVYDANFILKRVFR